MPYEETDSNGRENLRESYHAGTEMRPAGESDFKRLDVTDRDFTNSPTAGTINGIPYEKDRFGNWVPR
jgi:hypothetical protein